MNCLKTKIILLFVSYFYLQVFVATAQGWQPLNSPALNAYSISSIYIDTNENKMYVGGYFSHSNNSSFNGIAVWDGNSWDSLGDGLYNVPIKIGKFNDEIIACGAFNGLNPPYNVGNLVKWDGNNWITIGMDNYGFLSGFYPYNNGLLVYGGFDSIDSVHASDIAFWDGQNFHAIDTMKWKGHGIYDIEFYKGDLYIAGNFYNKDNTITDLARWDGSQWHALGTGNPMNNGTFITDLHVYKGKLYIAGQFFKITGCPGDNLITWDGQNWGDVGVGNINNQVVGLYEWNGDLYMGGIFHSFNNNDPAAELLKWDGENLCSFENYIYGGIVVLNSYNNNLVIGGSFYYIDGDTSINKLAMFNGFPQPDTCFSLPSGIEKVNTAGFNVFPNPASNMVYLEVAASFELRASSFEIVDIFGKVMLKEDLEAGKPIYRININDLPAGVYLLRVVGSDVGIVRKVVVVK